MYKHFKTKELECRCGCGLMPSRIPIDRLIALREDFGKPIIITSAVRCEQHNKRVGGAKGSFHLAGAAFDVQLPSKNDIPQFITLAYDNGFRGIGIIDQRKAILHIDCRKDSVWIVYK